jgi:hypothetical protein
MQPANCRECGFSAPLFQSLYLALAGRRPVAWAVRVSPDNTRIELLQKICTHVGGDTINRVGSLTWNHAIISNPHQSIAIAWLAVIWEAGHEKQDMTYKDVKENYTTELVGELHTTYWKSCNSWSLMQSHVKRTLYNVLDYLISVAVHPIQTEWGN